MSTETRREREKAMHRQEILEAAKRVFARKGFAGATIDEIAQEAEFSKGAMYIHFENKEDLFLSLIHERLDDMEQRLEEVVERSTEPEAKIRDLAETLLTFFGEDQAFYQIVASEMPRLEGEKIAQFRVCMKERYLHCFDPVQKVMEDAVSAGVLKPLDPRLLAANLLGIIHSLVVQWSLAGARGQVMDIAPLTLELFFDGARKKDPDARS